MIDVGTGDPRHLTLAEHRTDGPLREVVVADPRRDDELATVDYDRAVADWHAERALGWGAYLGAPEQILVSGPALEVETAADGVGRGVGGVTGGPRTPASALRTPPDRRWRRPR